MTADDRSGRPTDPFEARLEQSLRAYAVPASRRPSRETVDLAVEGAAQGVQSGSGAVAVRLRRGTGRSRDVRFLLLAAVLVLGTIGAGLLAGRFLEDERRPQATLPAVVLTSPGPSPFVITTPAPAHTTALTCASAVRQGAIRRINMSRDPGARWVAAPAPEGPSSNGLIAVGFRAETDLLTGVYLLDPAGGDPCLAVEHGLPTLGALRWASAGDALMIEAGAPDGTERNIFWSSAGATYLDGAWPPGDWSPDSTRVIVRGQILSVDGSPALPISCGDCTSSNVVGRPAWSPDGTRLAAGIWRPTSSGAFSRIAVGPATTGHLITFPSSIVDPTVIGWLDDRTLLVQERPEPAGDHIVGSNALWRVALDDPAASSQVGDLPAESVTFSRDLRRIAWVEHGPSRTELRTADLTDLQRTATILDVSSLGPGLDIGAFAWAPDGSRLAVEIVSVGDQSSKGLWTVGVDGSDLRQVTSLPVRLPPSGDPWQPIWP